MTGWTSTRRTVINRIDRLYFSHAVFHPNSVLLLIFNYYIGNELRGTTTGGIRLTIHPWWRVCGGHPYGWGEGRPTHGVLYNLQQ